MSRKHKAGVTRPPCIDERGYLLHTFTRDELDRARRYSPLPAELEQFLLRFQTDCVVECCGIDAFIWSEPQEDNLQWAPNYTAEVLLGEEQEKLRAFPSDVIIVTELNQVMLKSDLLCLFGFLEEGLRAVR